MYSVEWQKRGLPHAHILIWLQEKVHSSQIDNLISCELPSQEADQVLYDVVRTQMIHGPCGVLNPKSPCMKDGKCTKSYLKSFVKDTETGTDGYPKYRRRKPDDGGFSTTIGTGTEREMIVDNRWVVPYSPVLCKMFNAHINVEFCHSVKAIKYICKYLSLIHI